ncbi:flagellar motor switch protein FliY [Helicobacter cappadocius]|uniref:Flagellar motor switch protein FliN n=1 Tax=Helicobacter cappadocius TaxID=3063998 RepID=A0AA90PIN0_9HELI|nr:MULTISPECIES: flagellar motor switch protein FliY [unclassified Helicobacter]MDO7252664.1 flagellar motor switch protein FliY [Helicobacter sp. faydin-H75]MDP2538531.1 flagellar motor switch protein FliY [Helicobacter sp. faydin-H76]
MNDFIKIFTQEAISTIEGLTGNTPDIENNKTDIISGVSLSVPYVIAYVSVSGDLDSSVALIVPAELASALADLMVGGEGASKSDMDNDDLDALKEITSNIFGAISTALGSQKNLPRLSFSCKDIQFIVNPIDLSAYDKGYQFTFSINKIKSNFLFLTTSDFTNSFNHIENVTTTNVVETPANHLLNPDEMKNIGMLLDVKLNVKVRIGQKKMLLKDVISMDIGSVVELNQLANDPLEILVDDKVIAKGEVVIVDGNFGVQITDIGTKRERLEQLRG